MGERHGGVRRHLLYILAGFACLAAPHSVLAADLSFPAGPAVPVGQCIPVQPTPLLLLPIADLAREVWYRYEHAVVSAERPEVIYSARPVHTWALETRFYCGEAIGYLKKATVEAVSVSKCACFYDRMLRFMR